MDLLTSARIKLAFLLRIVVAVVLVLAMLSGIVPFKSASAGNLCTMSCCGGMPPHAAGSCHMEMPAPGKLIQERAPEPKSHEHCGAPEVDNKATGVNEGISESNGTWDVTAGAMRMTTSGESSLNLDDVTVDASAHDQANSQTEDATVAVGMSGSHRSDHPDYSASIAAHSLAKPCPPQCGSGPTVSRIRRSRDAATLVRKARLRLTFSKKYLHQSQDFLIVSAYRDQVHPRGPPFCFS